MFRNYLKITLRNLFKNRVFTLINVLGLGMALAISIVAYFNNMFSYDFDGQHVNRDEIYRVNCLRDMEGRLQEYGVVPATLGREIKKDVTELKDIAKLNIDNVPNNGIQVDEILPINELEKRVSKNNKDIQAIFEAIRQLMFEPEKPKSKIGFYV